MSNGACTHDYLGLKGLIMGDGDGGKSQLCVCRLRKSQQGCRCCRYSRHARADNISGEREFVNRCAVRPTARDNYGRRGRRVE